ILIQMRVTIDAIGEQEIILHYQIPLRSVAMLMTRTIHPQQALTSDLSTRGQLLAFKPQQQLRQMPKGISAPPSHLPPGRERTLLLVLASDIIMMSTPLKSNDIMAESPLTILPQS